jgi:probable selenate reductase FAD-binding subunit
LRRAEENAIPLAGGIAVAASRSAPEGIFVDLGALGLDHIELTEDELRLGAMVTLQALADSNEANSITGGLIGRAVRLMAPRQIRNQATLGGTLLSETTTESDLATLLLVLNADLVIAPGARQRETVPLETFLVGGRLERELLIEVIVPRPAPDIQTALHRIGRTPSDQAILVVAGAGRCRDGTIETVRLAVGGTGFRPVRLRAVERALRGTTVDSEAFATAIRQASAGLALPDDFRGSTEYRAAMLPVLVGRVLGDLCTSLD